ncbi:hypothetical protein LSH36_381g01033 [Paralvinella palmiformis]|uniref:Uncharacterized protein n=1 Tax=Paralvinella palmiformis TaxID=53620 RepID=A0AAD9JEM4_9ANNE|nr:hypothetical protein LSH36_381g01033 [Paralvinella palmiformis]
MLTPGNTFFAPKQTSPGSLFVLRIPVELHGAALGTGHLCQHHIPGLSPLGRRSKSGQMSLSLTGSSLWTIGESGSDPDFAAFLRHQKVFPLFWRQMFFGWGRKRTTACGYVLSKIPIFPGPIPTDRTTRNHDDKTASSKRRTRILPFNPGT